jgi:cysteine synthase
MIGLYDYLAKKLGKITLTRLPVHLNRFWGESQVWLIRTDLFWRGISIKALAAASLLFDAQETGRLKKTTEVLVCSSANFAIGTALLLPDFGNFRLTAIVPESIDSKKASRLLSLGAKIIKVASGALALAEQYAKDPLVVYLNQYANPAMTKGVEIYLAPFVYEQVKFNAAVLPLGTGGTAIGFNAYIQEHNIDATMVGVNLVNGEKVSGMRDKKRQEEVSLPWQKNIQHLVSVTREEAVTCTRALLAADIMVGTSTGAGVVGFDKWMWHQIQEGLIKEPITAVLPCPDSAYAFA